MNLASSIVGFLGIAHSKELGRLDFPLLAQSAAPDFCPMLPGISTHQSIAWLPPARGSAWQP
jgi:hypothetical protein